MKAVLQRVVQASVEVNGQQISKIRQGLCVLVGLSAEDTSADLDYMVQKLLTVKVFDSNTCANGAITESANGEPVEEQAPPKMWAKNVVDIGGEILCVSQFTLYAKTLKKGKLDFHLSMKSAQAKEMYHDFLDRLKKAYEPERIKDGEFGAMMMVNIANDGPVTIEFDSQESQSSSNGKNGVSANATAGKSSKA